MLRLLFAGVVCAAWSAVAMAADVPSTEFHPQWREVFPQDGEFFAEKYPEGALKGMHTRTLGRLNGASVQLHEDGSLRSCRFYPSGVAQGPVRVWDESKKMVLYSRYRDGVQHGVTCLWKDGAPWLLQDWKEGELQSESTVSSSGSLEEAKKKLAAVNSVLAADEKDLKANLRQWFADLKLEVKEQNEQAMTAAAKAQAKAIHAKAVKNKATVVAGAHSPTSHTGGAARALAGVAKETQKEAQKAAHKKAKQGAKAMRERDAELAKEASALYDFALRALEKTR